MPPAKKAVPAAKKVAASAKASPAKAAAQATVTLKHLAAALADNHEIAKKQAEAVLGISWPAYCPKPLRPSSRSGSRSRGSKAAGARGGSP